VSFSSDVQSCMSPLPVPSLDSGAEALELLHNLHQAWEASGGDAETVAGLVAAGALVGVDEAALAVLGAVAEATVVAYSAALAACVVAALGSSVWGLIASADTYVGSQLEAAAQQQGIPQAGGEPQALAANVPQSAQLSDDGNYWWDGAQWQPVSGQSAG